MTSYISNCPIGSLISPIKPKSIKTRLIIGLFSSLVLFTMNLHSSTKDVDELPILPSHYGHLKLDIETENLSHYTEFYFNSNATQGLDPGYDASVYGGNPPPFSIYSHLVQNNTGMAFAVQALSDTDMGNITIALGINASQGQHIEIRITETDLPESINIYIEDRATNTLTLLNDDTFSFTSTNDLSGTGRFYLLFEANALSTTERNLEELKIYSNNTSKTVTIKGNLESDTELRLFDINGRLVNYIVLDKVNINHTLTTNGLNAGVYIVKLSNKNSEKRTQKIIIQ